MLDTWLSAGDARPDDPRYDAIKANPPQGCIIGDFVYSFGLECVRPGTDLLDAVSSTCAEVRETYGHLFADVGVEKVEEWSSDGKDGWGAKILAQLLLMSAERARALGYTTDDLIRFLRQVGEP
ncbi:amidase [Nocardia seriolae]|nr:amidase [Nocardia seriolae]MTJ75902.1 amidase [Nocardia seriolae]MTJ87076.1 amidase [Nocardia seriolae]MTK31070.1 amidase [Nocardia seriolae]MTK40116.1 amidase [Nocardia seriolae]